MRKLFTALTLVFALLLAISSVFAQGIPNFGGMGVPSAASSLSSVSLEGTVAAPTATTSNPGVMMGLGSTCKMTPNYSGRISIRFDYTLTGSALVVATTGIRYADNAVTATPANGAALTGTTLGSTKAPFVGAAAANAQAVGQSMSGVITGLTVGHLYWFDLTLASNNGTSTSMTNVDCSGFEF